jgi:hypothetical protein
MGLAASFVAGVADLTKVPKLTPPLASTLPNAQSFGQAADTLDKWQADLSAKFKALQKARDEYMEIYKKWAEFNKSLTATGKTLESGVKKYVAQGRNWPQKEYMTGCQKIETGLDVIETKRKQIDSYYGPIDLKGA